MSKCMLCGHDEIKDLMVLTTIEDNISVTVCKGKCKGNEGNYFDIKIIPGQNTVCIYGDTHEQSYANAIQFYQNFLQNKHYENFVTIASSDGRFKTKIIYSND